MGLAPLPIRPRPVELLPLGLKVGRFFEHFAAVEDERGPQLLHGRVDLLDDYLLGEALTQFLQVEDRPPHFHDLVHIDLADLPLGGRGRLGLELARYTSATAAASPARPPPASAARRPGRPPCLPADLLFLLQILARAPIFLQEPIHLAAILRRERHRRLFAGRRRNPAGKAQHEQG